MPRDYVPEEYSRPAGEPYQAEITDAVALTALKDSVNGIWGVRGNQYPEAL
jgi:hypothetical protein